MALSICTSGHMVATRTRYVINTIAPTTTMYDVCYTTNDDRAQCATNKKTRDRVPVRGVNDESVHRLSVREMRVAGTTPAYICQF